MDVEDICNIYNISAPGEPEDPPEKVIGDFADLIDASDAESEDKQSSASASVVSTKSFVYSPPPAANFTKQTAPSKDKSESSRESSASSVAESVIEKPTKDSTLLLNDIIREMHKDVAHSDFGEKITIIYDIDREITRLAKLNVPYGDLEKPSEHMSLTMLQQLLLRYRAIRLNAGVEEFSTDTHIAIATALEKFFDGKREIFNMKPCLKGLSGRIGGLMTNTNIDSSAIFKRVLRGIGMFNDEGLTALGIVNALCLTLAGNSINTEVDVKSISR